MPEPSLVALPSHRGADAGNRQDGHAAIERERVGKRRDQRRGRWRHQRSGGERVLAAIPQEPRRLLKGCVGGELRRVATAKEQTVALDQGDAGCEGGQPIIESRGSNVDRLAAARRRLAVHTFEIRLEFATPYPAEKK